MADILGIGIDASFISVFIGPFKPKSQNVALGAKKKVILNTHMELDQFSIRQILSYCREIKHTENHSDPYYQKSRAEALLKKNPLNICSTGG